MKKLIFLLIIAGLSIGQAAAQSTISVKGESEIEVIPDMIRFQLDLQVNESSQTASIKNLNTSIDALISALEATGVPSDSIKTERFNTTQQDIRYGNKPEKRYITRQAMYFTIKAEEAHIIALLNALSKVENDINFSTSTLLSDKMKTKAQQSLLKQAFANAKQKAQLMSDAGGFQLGDIKHIDMNKNIHHYKKASDQMAEMVVNDTPDMNFGNYHLSPIRLNETVDVIYFISQ